MAEIIEKMRESLPPLFAGQAIDRLTGDAVRWNTLRNLKHNPDCPRGLFLKHGRKTLVERDTFLQWFASQLHVVKVNTEKR